MRILKNIGNELLGKGKNFGGRPVPMVPPAHPLFKNALSFAKGPLLFMIREWEKQGDIYDVNFPQVPFFVLSHPDYVKHVLVDNNRNYKKAFSFNFLRYTIGNGLLTNEGESWLKQRRTAQPAFHRQRLSALLGSMVTVTEQLVSEWQKKAAGRQTVALAEEMMKTTAAIVSRALFGTDVGSFSRELVHLITVLNQQTTHKVVNPLRSPMWLPTPNNLQLKNAIKRMDEIIFGIIEQRRISSAQQHDLLAMLMDARDAETGDQMDDRQLRDEVVTLMIAGTETSANALSWSFSLLMQHPEVLNRLRKEADEVLGSGPLSSESLGRLQYTTQVLNEAMRIYPPAWTTGREALSDDEIAGFPIPKGSQVYMCTYTVHRHPDFWAEPHRFDPDRFSPENSKGRHKFAFFPFGGGPRYCIGNNFAMMEMQVILATLVHHFEWQPLSALPPALDPLLSLRPGNEIRIRLAQR
ncbi:MAG: cytochrome P450 [Cyclobacteriaceae bacterium]